MNDIATITTSERARNAADWERQRTARIDAAAAALTHLNSALAMAPYSCPHSVIDSTQYAANGLRGHLRCLFDEPNPFV